MTARYTDAEKAAAKRIGYAPVLRGEAPDAAWLVTFREYVVGGLVSDADDARTVARAVAREQRKAARS